MLQLTGSLVSKVTEIHSKSCRFHRSCERFLSSHCEESCSCSRLW